MYRFHKCACTYVCVHRHTLTCANPLWKAHIPCSTSCLSGILLGCPIWVMLLSKQWHRLVWHPSLTVVEHIWSNVFDMGRGGSEAAVPPATPAILSLLLVTKGLHASKAHGGCAACQSPEMRRTRARCSVGLRVVHIPGPSAICDCHVHCRKVSRSFGLFANRHFHSAQQFIGASEEGPASFEPSKN